MEQVMGKYSRDDIMWAIRREQLDHHGWARLEVAQIEKMTNSQFDTYVKTFFKTELGKKSKHRINRQREINESLSSPNAVKELGEYLATHDVPNGEPMSLEDMKKTAFELSIKKFKGNIAEVCRDLGVSRATVYRALKRYGIDRNVSR